ncbi:MAG: CHAP domain-containing protein [Alphaproteobacteria bacterium]|nr:CHAP domain-containing protein [Alphaproteobacteria bacterium]
MLMGRLRRNRGRGPAQGAILLAALLIGACAGPQAGAHPNQANTAQATAKATAIPAATIIATAAPLQCVPYARSVTNINIRGDAWTWWQSAEGRYRRDNQPAVGAVMVLKRTNRLQRGHISVVSHILNSREILVEHANWLNRGQIHQNAMVRDVSANNDWSAVRVWYTPGRTLGKRTYPAHGFIHPAQAIADRLRQS